MNVACVGSVLRLSSMCVGSVWVFVVCVARMLSVLHLCLCSICVAFKLPMNLRGAERHARKNCIPVDNSVLLCIIFQAFKLSHAWRGQFALIPHRNFVQFPHFFLYHDSKLYCHILQREKPWPEKRKYQKTRIVRVWVVTVRSDLLSSFWMVSNAVTDGSVFPATPPLVIGALRVFYVLPVMRSANGMYFPVLVCREVSGSSFVTVHFSAAPCNLSRNDCHLHAFSILCTNHKSFRSTRSTVRDSLSSARPVTCRSLAVTMQLCSAAGEKKVRYLFKNIYFLLFIPVSNSRTTSGMHGVMPFSWYKN